VLSSYLFDVKVLMDVKMCGGAVRIKDAKDRTGCSIPLSEVYHLTCYFPGFSLCSRCSYIPSGVANSEVRRSYTYLENALESCLTKRAEHASVHVNSAESGHFCRN
jgi:hypothetical protein